MFLPGGEADSSKLPRLTRQNFEKKSEEFSVFPTLARLLRENLPGLKADLFPME